MRFTVCRSFDSFGGNISEQVGWTFVPSLRVKVKMSLFTEATWMNQSSVTGMLSRPVSPVGQEALLFKPHAALKILGCDRAPTVGADMA
jgi:hypothetical protein